MALAISVTSIEIDLKPPLE